MTPKSYVIISENLLPLKSPIYREVRRKFITVQSNNIQVDDRKFFPFKDAEMQGD
jgi:hypothetical protein